VTALDREALGAVAGGDTSAGQYCGPAGLARQIDTTTKLAIHPPLRLFTVDAQVSTSITLCK